METIVGSSSLLSSRVGRLVATVGFVLVATALRYALIPTIGYTGPFVLYYLTVFACAFYLGFWSGLLSVFLSATMALFFFIEPVYQIAPKDTGHALFTLLFALSSLLIVTLTERLHREIESRANLERSLRHSEETFRGIFDNARDDAVVLMNADRHIVAWNSGAELITGWSQSEVLSRTDSFLSSPEDQGDRLPEGELDVAREKGRAIFTRWLMRKDGSRFWASGTITVLRHTNGAPRGYVMLFRDETERKRVQDLLQSSNEELERRVEERTEELQELVRELEGFTYSISHDMRAPLRSMVANSQMLLEDYSDVLPDDGKTHLRRVSGAAVKMAQLVEDLLVHARLGRTTLAREMCALSSIASDLRSLMDAGCNLVIEEGAETPVYCDPNLIRMVLQNLLENACKYRSRHVEAEVRLGRKGDVFYVRDNGIGFDMKYVDKIFEPFERLHRDVDYPGTGIGLANVKRVVQMHGGRIWAESEPGKGSTFYFTLG